MEPIIADATPLILLAKLTLLDVLCDRLKMVIPMEVAKEATHRQDLADARYIQKLIDEKRIQIRRANARQTSQIRRQWGLGKGEAEALTLALKEQAVIMSDDFAAIRVGKAMHLKFTTTPLMIVELERQNLISRDMARAKLVELKKHAWVSSQVLARAKEILEEGGT